MKCPKCGSNNIRTERRPNGFNWDNECGHQWQSEAVEPYIHDLIQADMVEEVEV